MLTSLFGDLRAARDAKSKASDFEETQVVNSSPDFAATAIMESIATEVNERGQIIDRHVSDLVVTGSPAQAIREHFATTRADLETATSMITLLDPVGVWASSVVKALSDAGGRPIEKLHLREHTTLRTIAMIERTTLVRRNEDTLRIFHADVRAPGPENAEIPVALMERSQMTAVIIGPMQPHAIDALLASLRHATSLATWRCAHLLFQLPPNAAWIDDKVHAIAWPERLHVHIVSEPMTGASSVWNAMLNVWNEAKLEPGWDPTAVSPMLGTSDFPIKVGELDPKGIASARPAEAEAAAAAVAAATGHGVLDAARGRLALASLRKLDGLLGCALVDAATGLVLAHEARDPQAIDMEHAAAACAQVLASQRAAAQTIGLADPIDEIITTAGSRHVLIRALQRHADLVLVALLEKHRTNLALARFQLLEVERSLP
ncbi:MAG TPA: roadblock/LC7 domain-containing protein [Caldimonas sp.]|jgi:predicted regulator of Ras-like GTPase activity (Roadblock/LC7/MglB family)